jgi:hypothetical protein
MNADRIALRQGSVLKRRTLPEHDPQLVSIVRAAAQIAKHEPNNYHA